eukprot:Nitzschia sp. Nitz4//scaffold44_size153857//35095//36926//NITZ4_002706-RA/size153857-augustus-gene-0.15-mRNA-1//-1//CDS//3329552112//4752//frame0
MSDPSVASPIQHPFFSFGPSNRRPNWDLAQLAGVTPFRLPQTAAEADKAQDVLAEDMANMSLDEQERVLFDVHGVCQVDEMDPPSQQLANLLVQLEKELCTKPCPYYHRAHAVNPYYVEKESFRLLFLRSQRFNAAAAAELMEFHFQTKALLFVDDPPDEVVARMEAVASSSSAIITSNKDEILGRDIRLSDLSPSDWVALRSGCSQVLPQRDAGGRTILALSLSARTKLNYLDPRHVSRSTWYVVMDALSDVTTQKKGLVTIGYHMDPSDSSSIKNAINAWGSAHQQRGHTPANTSGATTNKSKGLLSGIGSASMVRGAMPARLSAAHFCFANPAVRFLASGIALFLPSHARKRYRMHHGTVEQVHFQLQTFGVPTQFSPMQADGTWSLAWHAEWIEMQLQREVYMNATQHLTPSPMSTIPISDDGNSSNTTSDSSGNEGTNPTPPAMTTSSTIITLPQRFDVLFGKSRKEKESTGNLRALHLVEMNFDRYQEASKFKKTEIAESIVAAIHHSGGRFLRRVDMGWEEVSDEAAREKVSHFFRQGRVKIQRQQHAGSSPGLNDDGKGKKRKSSMEE